MIVLAALAAVAVVFSACALIKPGSLSLSQPAGIGSARVHFVICTEPEGSGCTPSEDTEDVQYLLGIAVPPGSTPPATINAVPVGGGSPLVFTRNDEVATEIAASSVNLHKFAEEEGKGNEEGTQVWPPAGLQGVGYLSSVQPEKEGQTIEWNLDPEFGLPVPADGSPFTGPFATGLAYGSREAGPGQSSTRPVHCWRFESAPEEGESFCFGTLQQGQVGTSDLKLAAPPQGSAFLGGKAALGFTANFASTAAALPAFSLSATSTLPGAKLQLPSPTFAPGAPNPTTHLSPPATQTVNVTAPKNAKPGTYEVTLTATTPQGASTSQVAKLKVVKAKIGLGGAKLNKAKGTATLSVKIPGAGTLTASGKGIAKSQKKAKNLKKPKTLKLTIKPKGKAKKLLAEEGTAKVSVKVTFKPSSGVAVTKTKRITLKQN
ncbi:MAG: hypothetical protein ACJ75T_04885 [Solirubrobacterales bacterium]